MAVPSRRPLTVRGSTFKILSSISNLLSTIDPVKDTRKAIIILKFNKTIIATVRTSKHNSVWSQLAASHKHTSRLKKNHEFSIIVL
jgi:hypothetical protein